MFHSLRSSVPTGRPHLRFIHAWPPGVTRTILWHSAQRYLPLQFGFLQGVIRRRQTCQHLSRTFALRLATTSLPARQRSNSKHSRSVEFTKLRVHYVFAHAKTSDTKILPFAHVTLANRYYLPHSKLFLLLLALHRPSASAARALFLMQVQATVSISLNRCSLIARHLSHRCVPVPNPLVAFCRYRRFQLFERRNRRIPFPACRTPATHSRQTSRNSPSAQLPLHSHGES